MDELTLIPQPRHLIFQGGVFRLMPRQLLVGQGDPLIWFPIALCLQQACREQLRIQLELNTINATQQVQEGIVLRITPSAPVPPQGYRLGITTRKIEVLAKDGAGLFYGVMTLKQWLRQNSGFFHTCILEDYPDFPVRGVMLDISRDKVPTLSTLFTLIDQLAELKINHLELYTEHTFAYRDHPEVWAEASPLTGEDVLRLDAFCRKRFIELVPNQNSLGHWQRWLQISRYRHLAECPNGFEWPWGGRSEQPFSLDPRNPRTLKLLEALYAELLPHFTSRKINVGLDECLDLGQGKNKELCRQKGVGPVYLEFLLQVHRLVSNQGLTMHFWGDIIIQYPELIGKLPENVVPLEWGYEADHPFDDHCKSFAQAGLPFYVCPGTSSWRSITGRSKNCLENLKNAAFYGRKNGAIGYLITDWGDQGHWQHLPFSFLGIAAGAAFSWCYETNQKMNFVPALDLHIFQDRARVMGGLVYELGNAYLQVGQLVKNASALFHLLVRPITQNLSEGITCITLQQTAEFILATMEPLKWARSQRADAVLVADEFRNAAQFLLYACQRGIAIRKETTADSNTRKRLTMELIAFLGEYRRIWMMRNREGGLRDSTRMLEIHLQEYAETAHPVNSIF